ncbi:hypothetical protein [Frankia gtarii]|uniref:hypothetical protein n=1 Tax=Frankia gtarii TaxID=2950102 RepID=UPI0021C13809|nr:hypothetical protein [Frankia gtarii]
MTGRGELAADVVATTLRAAELVGVARHLPPADLERSFFAIFREISAAAGPDSDAVGRAVAELAMGLARFVGATLDEWAQGDPDAAEGWLADVVAGVLLEAERRRSGDA